MIKFNNWLIDFERLVATSSAGKDHQMMRLNNMFYLKVNQNWKFWPCITHTNYDSVTPAFEYIVFDEYVSQEVYKLYEEYLIEEILLK